MQVGIFVCDHRVISTLFKQLLIFLSFSWFPTTKQYTKTSVTPCTYLHCWNSTFICFSFVFNIFFPTKDMFLMSNIFSYKHFSVCYKIIRWLFLKKWHFFFQAYEGVIIIKRFVFFFLIIIIHKVLFHNKMF